VEGFAALAVSEIEAQQALDAVRQPGMSRAISRASLASVPAPPPTTR
jgi:hypothetical protein